MSHEVMGEVFIKGACMFCRSVWPYVMLCIRMYPDRCERRTLEMENHVVNLRIRVYGSTKREHQSISVGVYIVTFSLSGTHKPIILAFFVVRAKVPSKTTRKARHSVVRWVQRSTSLIRSKRAFHGDSMELGKPRMCNRLHVWVCLNYLRAWSQALKIRKPTRYSWKRASPSHHGHPPTRDISKIPGWPPFACASSTHRPNRKGSTSAHVAHVAKSVALLNVPLGTP